MALQDRASWLAPSQDSSSEGLGSPDRFQVGGPLVLVPRARVEGLSLRKRASVLGLVDRWEGLGSGLCGEGLGLL